MRMNQDQDAYDQLADALSPDQMGDIASDHIAELDGFTGGSYIAVNAIARQTARAKVLVYDDAKLGPMAKAHRRDFRKEFGIDWRKSVSREHQGTVVQSEHPLLQLLQQPNPKQTGSHFRWEQMIQLRLHGSAIVWNRPNVLGNRTVERYVVPHAWITPLSPGQRPNMPRGGIKITPRHTRFGYAFSGTLYSMAGIEIPVNQLTIARYPHPALRGDGASPTSAGSAFIDTHALIREYRTKYFKENPGGKVIISTEQDMTPDQARNWSETYSELFGPDGPATVVMNAKHVLADKKTAEELGFDASDDKMYDFILSLHQISKAFVGNVDNMTFGSVAASVLAAIEFAVQPDLDLIADEDTLDLANEYGGLLCVEYECPKLADPQLQQQAIQDAANRGVLTVGQYLSLMGLPADGHPFPHWILTSTGPVPPDKLGVVTTQPQAEAPQDREVPSTQGSAHQAIGLSVRGTVLDDMGRINKANLPAIQKMHQGGARFVLVGWPEDVDAARQITKGLGIQIVETTDLPEATWDAEVEDSGEFLERVADIIEEVQEPAHRYGWIGLPLPNDMAEYVLQLGRELIADEDLGPGGRELEPHVTLLYGITGIPADEVVQEVRCLKSPTIQTGMVASFPAGKDGVPVFLEVEGPQLHQLNGIMRDVLPHVCTHPEYHPHITLGYVRPEVAARFADRQPCTLTNISAVLKRAVVSMPDSDPVNVPLRQNIGVLV